MPTVIDELVVVLGLDPTKFTQGQKEALAAFQQTRDQSVQTANVIEAQGKKTQEFFSGLKREALTLLAGFLGGRGIKEFVGYITNLDAEVGRTSKSLGMSTEALSAWRNVAEQTGGTAEGITGTLHGLDRELNTFLLTGQSGKLPVFRQLGIDIFNANNQLKTSGQILIDLIDKTAALDPRRRAAVLSFAGVDEATINAVLTMGPAYKELLELEEKHAHISDKDAKAAIDRQKSFAGLEQAARDLGQSIVTYVTPALITMMDKFKELLQLWNQTKEQGAQTAADNRAALISRFGSPRDSAAYLFGKDAATKLYGPRSAATAAGSEIHATGLPAEARGLLRAISPGESGGAYDVEYGGSKFSDYSAHPNAPHRITSGPHAGENSTAAGRYQMLYKTWMEAKEALGLPDFSPASQDKAAWWLAQRDYNAKTGRNLLSDLQSGDDKIISGIGNALSGTWTSLPGGIESHGRTSLPIGAGGAAATSPGVINNKTIGGGTHTSEVNVGAIHLTSSEADPKDVAAEIPAALRRTNWAASANYSLSG